MSGNDSEATVFLEQSGLGVRIASPRYLFVMKARAGRETHLDDLRILYRLVVYSGADEAITDVVAAYPVSTIRPAVQYLIEGIAAEVGII